MSAVETSCPAPICVLVIPVAQVVFPSWTQEFSRYLMVLANVKEFSRAEPRDSGGRCAEWEDQSALRSNRRRPLRQGLSLRSRRTAGWLERLCSGRRVSVHVAREDEQERKWDRVFRLSVAFEHFFLNLHRFLNMSAAAVEEKPIPTVIPATSSSSTMGEETSEQMTEGQ